MTQFTDYYNAIQTYFKDDFSGVAKFMVDDITVDLLITGVFYNIGDYHKIVPSPGDFFKVYYFGRNPIILSIKATLIDSDDNFGKAELIKLYTEKLRLSAVAQDTQLPCLVLPGLFIHGGLIELVVEESSETQTTVNISMQMVVLGLFYEADGDSYSIDFSKGLGILEESGKEAGEDKGYSFVGSF